MGKATLLYVLLYFFNITVLYIQFCTAYPFTLRIWCKLMVNRFVSFGLSACLSKTGNWWTIGSGWLWPLPPNHLQHPFLPLPPLLLCGPGGVQHELPAGEPLHLLCPGQHALESFHPYPGTKKFVFEKFHILYSLLTYSIKNSPTSLLSNSFRNRCLEMPQSQCWVILQHCFLVILQHFCLVILQP